MPVTQQPMHVSIIQHETSATLSSHHPTTHVHCLQWNEDRNVKPKLIV